MQNMIQWKSSHEWDFEFVTIAIVVTLYLTNVYLRDLIYFQAMQHDSWMVTGFE